MGAEVEEVEEDEEVEADDDTAAPDEAKSGLLLSLSGEFKQVCIKALPASEIIIGCNFLVAKVYTCPVSDATNNIT